MEKNIDILFERNEEQFNAFFQTMYERQLIWKRRFIDKKDAPWTNNSVFKKYKFTNVYRELDRNSQYCINKIIKPNAKAPLNNLVWKVLVFRLFNNPETFECASKIWPCGIPDYDKYLNEKNEYAKFMEDLSKKSNIFTNAYFIWSTRANGYTRTDCYTKIVLPKLHTLIRQIIRVCENCAAPYDIIRIFKEIPGVSNFVAFELYNDLLYINKFINYNLVLFDSNKYVNVGPGSKMGLNLIYPNLKGTDNYKKAMHMLLDLAYGQLLKIGLNNSEPMPYAKYNPETESYFVTDKCNLTIGNIEHWLCEYSKYYRLANEANHKQRIFKPVSNNDLYNYEIL